MKSMINSLSALILLFGWTGLMAENAVKQVMLEQHNTEREALELTPLEWSDELAASAQLWANTLAVLDKASHSDSGFGENIWFGAYQSISLDEMAGIWLAEKQYFLADKPVPQNCSQPWEQCGHYSQMVWADTTDLGCAMASSEKNSYLVCHYSPAGNVQDQLAY